MKYKNINYLFIAFAFLLVQSCTNPPPDADGDGFVDDVDNCPKVPNKTNKGCPYDQYNYVILLDLSDRILQPSQIKRDIDIISGIYDFFLEKLKKELYFTNKDQLKILITNQKTQFPTDNIFEIEDDLDIDMKSVAIRDKVKKKKSKEGYITQVKALYKEAKFSNNPNDYDGADIYGYLKNRFDNDRIEGDFTENFLIILTDGYQYVKGSSYRPLGPFPIATDLSDINVAVVELNPINKNPNELQKIKTAWKNWMGQMNVKHLMLLNKQGIKNLNKQLKDFFENPQKKSLTITNTPKEKPVNQSPRTTSTPSIPKIKQPKAATSINTTSSISVLPKSSEFTEKASTSRKKKTYYADFDGDGLGDPTNTIISYRPQTNYILTSGDKCPTRQGSKNKSGCPVLKIMPNHQDVYVDEDVRFVADFPITNGDQIRWACRSCLIKSKNTNSKIQFFKFSRLGREKIELRLSNFTDGINEFVSRDITIKLSKERLKLYLDEIIQLSDKNNFYDNNKFKIGKKRVLKIRSFTTPNCTVIHSKNKQSILGDGSIDDFIRIAQQPYITQKIPFLESGNFTVADIIYETSSGKIRQIVLQDI